MGHGKTPIRTSRSWIMGGVRGRRVSVTHGPTCGVFGFCVCMVSMVYIWVSRGLGFSMDNRSVYIGNNLGKKYKGKQTPTTHSKWANPPIWFYRWTYYNGDGKTKPTCGALFQSDHLVSDPSFPFWLWVYAFLVYVLGYGSANPLGKTHIDSENIKCHGWE